MSNARFGTSTRKISDTNADSFRQKSFSSSARDILSRIEACVTTCPSCPCRPSCLPSWEAWRSWDSTPRAPSSVDHFWRLRALFPSQRVSRQSRRLANAKATVAQFRHLARFRARDVPKATSSHPSSLSSNVPTRARPLRVAHRHAVARIRHVRLARLQAGRARPPPGRRQGFRASRPTPRRRDVGRRFG